jgi:hypothetical protein
MINDDTEPHTVTSGLGDGLATAATNSKGKPNGFFDRRLFKPSDSWSFKLKIPISDVLVKINQKASN